MACRLFGAKPLPEPVLTYCQVDPCEQTSVKFESKCKTFQSWKCIRKCGLQKGGHFVRGEMSQLFVNGSEIFIIHDIDNVNLKWLVFRHCDFHIKVITHEL